MPPKRKPARKASAVPVEVGLFLTIGVPAGDRGKRQIKRAAELLQREGFLVGVTSNEAILAAAAQIKEGDTNG